MSTKRVSVADRGSLLSAKGSATPKSRNPEKKKSRRDKISLEIRPDLHRELRKLAANKGRKMYELVNEALTSYVEKSA